MIKYFCSKKLFICTRRYSNKLIIYKKDLPLELFRKDVNDMDTVSIRDIISFDFKKANTNFLTDVLNTCGNKFEDEAINYVDKNYDIISSDEFQVLFLSLLAKGYFLKYNQIIPLLRCYDVTKSDILDKKSWEVVGRVINNCMNIYSDSDLIELCFYLVRINNIPSHLDELEIFWKRVYEQKDNWISRLHKLDVITLVHLLEVCMHVNLGEDVLQLVLDTIKESSDFYYRLNDLPVISLLIDVMDRNSIIDMEILDKALPLLSIIDEKALFKSVSLSDFVGLVWNYGNFAVKSEAVRQSLSCINVFNLASIGDNVIRHHNDKLYLKLSKSLYLLGHEIDKIILPDIEPHQCHVIFDRDILGCLYALRLVKDPQLFFDKYADGVLDKVDLPRCVKMFYRLTFADQSIDDDLVREYLDQILTLSDKLSCHFIIKNTEKLAVIMEHSGTDIGIVPCHSLDFVYCTASDNFIGELCKRHPNISFFKVCFTDWRSITTKEAVKRVLEVAGSHNITTVDRTE